MSRSLPPRSLSARRIGPHCAACDMSLDEEPGFTRQLNGKGSSTSTATARRLRDKRQLTRIESLAIPPAWTEVWICRYADGHLQATGRDARGRKQYLYHEHWREISNAAKFWRLKPLSASFCPICAASVTTRSARPRTHADTRAGRNGRTAGPAPRSASATRNTSAKTIRTASRRSATRT